MVLENSKHFSKISRKGYLKKVTLGGHRKRFGYPATAAQSERIDYEISVIAEKKLGGHFIVLAETLEYLRKFGVMEKIEGEISASFVAYCLGISDIDPLRHDIIFESYLIPKTGTLSVCEMEVSDNSLIITVRNKDGKYQNNLLFPDIRTSRLKTEKSDYSDTEMLDAAKEGLKDLFNSIVINLTPLVIFKRHNKSSSDKLFSFVKYEHLSGKPFYLINNDFFLIQETLRNIKRYCGKELKLPQIPLEDPKTYELFARRDVDDINKLEFDKLKIEIGHFGIRNFNDLIIFAGAVTSTFYPELITGDYIMEDVYDIVYRKENPETIPVKYPAITEILQESYGYILFYEHIVKIAARTAGLTISEACRLADILISDDISIKAKEREIFLRKARNTGYTAEESAEILNIICRAERFWCKARVADWALYIYRTLYLKANYPKEYNTALIAGTKGESEYRKEGE